MDQNVVVEIAAIAGHPTVMDETELFAYLEIKNVNEKNRDKKTLFTSLHVGDGDAHQVPRAVVLQSAVVRPDADVV